MPVKLVLENPLSKEGFDEIIRETIKLEGVFPIGTITNSWGLISEVYFDSHDPSLVIKLIELLSGYGKASKCTSEEVRRDPRYIEAKLSESNYHKILREYYERKKAFAEILISKHDDNDKKRYILALKIRAEVFADTLNFLGQLEDIEFTEIDPYKFQIWDDMLKA